MIINGFTNSTLFEINLLVGYERQKYIKRFCYYYGLDLEFRYEIRKDKVENGRWMSSEGEKRGLVERTDLSAIYMVSPFLGVKYNINHRFGVSLESKAHAFYTFSKKCKLWRPVRAIRKWN